MNDRKYCARLAPLFPLLLFVILIMNVVIDLSKGLPQSSSSSSSDLANDINTQSPRSSYPKSEYYTATARRQKFNKTGRSSAIGRKKKSRVRQRSWFRLPDAAEKQRGCELAQELYQLGVPRHEIPHWICIAQYGAHWERNITTALPPSRRSGYRTRCTSRHGLFQLDDRNYCYERTRAEIAPHCGRPDTQRRNNNRCNLACDRLRDEDIRDDILCARLARGLHGFDYWRQWTKHCLYNPYLYEFIDPEECPLVKRSREGRTGQRRPPSSRVCEVDGRPVDHVDCAEWKIVT